MKLWGLVAVAVGAVGIAVLAGRDSTSAAPIPNQREPMPSPNPLPPAGYRRYSGPVDSEMSGQARAALSDALGSWHPFTHSSGSRMGALVEWHYHDPATGVKPLGWHKGASLFVRS